MHTIHSALLIYHFCISILILICICLSRRLCWHEGACMNLCLYFFVFVFVNVFVFVDQGNCVGTRERGLVWRRSVNQRCLDCRSTLFHQYAFLYFPLYLYFYCWGCLDCRLTLFQLHTEFCISILIVQMPGLQINCASQVCIFFQLQGFCSTQNTQNPKARNIVIANILLLE